VLNLMNKAVSSSMSILKWKTYIIQQQEQGKNGVIQILLFVSESRRVAVGGILVMHRSLLMLLILEKYFLIELI